MTGIVQRFYERIDDAQSSQMFRETQRRHVFKEVTVYTQVLIIQLKGVID